MKAKKDTMFARVMLPLLFLLLPATVTAQFLYVTNDNSITITKYTGSNPVVNIPDSTNGLPVTSIGSNAFYNLYLVTSVTIPDTITNIDAAAFSDCTALTNVTIPASVTSLGTGVFAGCNALTAIMVDPQNFSYSNINGVLLNGNYTTLIEFPAGKGGNYSIPNGINTIGVEAFLNCTNLTSVVIPASVYSMGEEAFFGCTSLTNVTLSSSLESIPPKAFEGCVDLASVAIPISVTDIQDGAFENCSNLAGVYFPGNAPATNATAFTGDTLATAYYLPGTMGWTTTFDGIPTAPLVAPNSLKINSGAGLGMQSNYFGFIISGPTNLSIVVEACTNLVNPVWSPVATNILTNGSASFSDLQWTNYPGRFYRLRSP